MATKTVGIRELKNEAPKLVQRAQQGERFVITRHGKVAAELGPVARPRALVEGRSRLQAWVKEREAFERLSPDLPKRLHGRFVAVYEGRVVDSDMDASVLFERVARAVPGCTFFVGRVGGAEPFVDMPGFDVE